MKSIKRLGAFALIAAALFVASCQCPDADKNCCGSAACAEKDPCAEESVCGE